MHQTNIVQIGNSKGIRIPKELINALGATKVILQKTEEGILIKPAPTIPPLNEWAAIFAQADTSPESELTDWDATISDGLENEAPYE